MHVIRLHGPWTAEILGPQLADNRRVHLPRDWDDLTEDSEHASVTLARRFHRPSGLDAGTRVFLAVPRGWPVASFTVNGGDTLVPELSEDKLRFDVTAIVRAGEAHDLRIQFWSGRGLKGQGYLVAIEIEDDGE